MRNCVYARCEGVWGEGEVHLLSFFYSVRHWSQLFATHPDWFTLGRRIPVVHWTEEGVLGKKECLSPAGKRVSGCAACSLSCPQIAVCRLPLLAGRKRIYRYKSYCCTVHFCRIIESFLLTTNNCTYITFTQNTLISSHATHKQSLST